VHPNYSAFKKARVFTYAASPIPELRIVKK